MGDMKSAHEIAMAKVAEIGEATEEERLRWKYVPEGEKLAARYLESNRKPAYEIGHYDEKARKYVTAGAVDIILRTINLPKSDLAKRNNKKASAETKLTETRTNLDFKLRPTTSLSPKPVNLSLVISLKNGLFTI